MSRASSRALAFVTKPGATHRAERLMSWYATSFTAGRGRAGRGRSERRADTQFGAALSVELAEAPGMDDDLLETEARACSSPRSDAGVDGQVPDAEVVGDEVRFALFER